MPKLSERSLRALENVHPSLVAVVKRAIEITTQDFMVIEGKRSLERQKELYAQGRTTAGNIVTWTMESKHLTGRAVDIVIYRDGPRWEPLSGFKLIAEAMKSAAAELGVPIEWGGDWTKTKDRPHFQLKDGWEPKEAPIPVPKPKPAPAPSSGPLRPIPEATTVTHRDVQKTGGLAALIVAAAALIGGIIAKIKGWF